MLEIVQDAGPVMAAIVLLAFICPIIIIERLLFFRKIRVDEDQTLERLKQTLSKEHYDEALSICENNPSPITNLAKVGIQNRHLDTSLVKDTIQDAANMEIPALERFLSTLGTIANIAPLLGLLGTVIGIIDSFGIFGSGGISNDTPELASGISQALLTTAAGIIVSIPATIFYNYLVSKVNHIIIRLENRVTQLVSIIRRR